MKALVLNGPGEPFSLETVPDPTPGPGEAVARVLACGAGLTVQHVRAGRASVDYPRIVGHEIAAEIVAVGAGVTTLAVGDPVTAYFYLTCGHCRACRTNRSNLCENFGGFVGRAVDGGYAELVRLPERSFIKIPGGLDWRAHPAEAGVVTDAVATPLKVIRHAGVTGWDTVAVIGAGGGLGIHMVAVASWAHARVVAVETVKAKEAACRDAGADDFVDPGDGHMTEALLDLTHGRGVDVVIDFVSSTETLNAGSKALARGGRLVTLGGAGGELTASAQFLLNNEAAIMGSRYCTHQDVIDSLDLVARGEIWPLVTEVRPMQEANALHDRIEAGLVTGRAALTIV